MIDLAMMNFYRLERPRLLADGIVDAAEQDQELTRRWQAITAMAASPDTLALDAPLSESERAELSLVSQGLSRGSDGVKFLYALDDDPTATVAEAPPPPRKRCRENENEKNFAYRLLLNFKKDILQTACRDLDLPVSGNKESLARAIVVHASK